MYNSNILWGFSLLHLLSETTTYGIILNSCWTFNYFKQHYIVQEGAELSSFIFLLFSHVGQLQMTYQFFFSHMLILDLKRKNRDNERGEEN